MKKIEDFAIYALKTRDTINYFDVLLTAFALNEQFCGLFTKQLDALRSCYNRMLKVFDRHRANLLTPEIETADARRDTLYSLFSRYVKTELGNSDPTKAKAAQELDFVLRDIGNLNNVSYTMQTASLDKFKRDISQDHSDALTQLSLTDLFNEVNDANQQLKDLFSERIESNAGRENGEMQAAITDAIDAYRNLIIVVTARILNDGVEGIEQTVDFWNSQVSYYRLKVGQSSGVPDAKPDDETTAPEQTPDLTPDETPAEGGEQKPENPDEKPENPDEKPGNSEGSENNPSTPGTPSNPSNPTDPDDPDALKPGPGGDDPDL